MKRDDFISSIGYDGAAAVVDKARKAKNSSKSLMQLLESGAFRSAAALALYNNSQEDLQTVADYYNTLADAHYCADTITRVFGISRNECKKTILL